MAELGAIASIVGLAGAGVKVSFALFDLADRIGSAGDEVKTVATEMSLFCSVLQEVGSVLQDTENTRLTPAALSLVEEVTKRCREVVTEIETVVSSLTRDQNPLDLPSLEWTGRVKWTFKRSKVQVQRQTLESCKSTLQLLLTTLRWSRRASMPKVPQYNAFSDEDQYQLVAQGLVLAVRSAVNQLRDLEDQADRETDQGHPSHRQSASITKLFEGLSTRTRSPSPLPKPVRRTSTWLDKLVFNQVENAEPHPGERRYRFSSATTVNDPLALLQKWTEERPRRQYVVDESIPPPVFASLDFGQLAENVVPVQTTPTEAKLIRVKTIGVSPKSTLAVQPAKMPQPASISLPQLVEALEEDWPSVSYERWMSLTLSEVGVTYQPDDYELVLTYGGHERTLLPTERPYAVFEDLSRYQLRPNFMLRRRPGVAANTVASNAIIDEPFAVSPTSNGTFI